MSPLRFPNAEPPQTKAQGSRSPETRARQGQWGAEPAPGQEKASQSSCQVPGLQGGHPSTRGSPAQDGGCTRWPVTTPPSHTSQRDKLLHLMEQQFAAAVPTSTHGGLQPPHGGHCWHAEEFPSTKFMQMCPMTCPGMLVRPSGTCAKDEPAGASPCPPIGSDPHIRSCLHTGSGCFSTAGSQPGPREPPALPSTASRQEAAPLQLPRSQVVPFQKPHSYPWKETPTPPPSEGAPAAPCKASPPPQPSWAAGQEGFGSSCSSSPGDAAPSSAHAGRV